MMMTMMTCVCSEEVCVCVCMCEIQEINGCTIKRLLRYVRERSKVCVRDRELTCV